MTAKAACAPSPRSPVSQLTGFVRFQLGEGIEKPKDDFAAEVAATAGV